MVNPSNKEVAGSLEILEMQRAERLLGRLDCVLALVLCSSIGICLWPVGDKMGEWKEGIGFLLVFFFVIGRTVIVHGNLATVARNH